NFAAIFWKMAEIVMLLGCVAMLLAVVGIYGVISFSVSRRTREVGIRMALGATRAEIVRCMIGSGVRPVIAGVSAGMLLSIVGAVALRQALRATPIGLNAADPVAYVAVAVLLVFTAFCAMLGPALRAARSDPSHALRHD